MACLASLTGIQLGAFPDVPDDMNGRESEINNKVTRLLHAYGWQLHRLWTHPEAVPQGWAIAGGTSPRGLFHAVVVFNGVLAWDPHPSRAGLAAIEEYEVLVPVRPGNALPTVAGALSGVALEPSEAAIETLRKFIASTLEGSAARKQRAMAALEVLGAAGRGSAGPQFDKRGIIGALVDVQAAGREISTPRAAAREAAPSGPWKETVTVNGTTTITDGMGRFIYLRPNEVAGVLEALNRVAARSPLQGEGDPT